MGSFDFYENPNTFNFSAAEQEYIVTKLKATTTGSCPAFPYHQRPLYMSTFEASSFKKWTFWTKKIPIFVGLSAVL